MYGVLDHVFCLPFPRAQGAHPIIPQIIEAIKHLR